jgi:hypothetical protein
MPVAESPAEQQKEWGWFPQRVFYGSHPGAVSLPLQKE